MVGGVDDDDVDVLGLGGGGAGRFGTLPEGVRRCVGNVGDAKFPSSPAGKNKTK